MPYDQGKFIIIGNYYKTDKIQQLYKLSIMDKQVTLIGEQEGSNNIDEEKRIKGYLNDTFYHQYYLRESPNSRENVYLLGGNHIHQINFKNAEWKTVGKGSYEFSDNWQIITS